MLQHLAAQVTCVPVTLLLLSISLEAFPAPSLSILLDLWMQRQQSSSRTCTFTNSVKQLGLSLFSPLLPSASFTLSQGFLHSAAHFCLHKVIQSNNIWA